MKAYDVSVDAGRTFQTILASSPEVAIRNAAARNKAAIAEALKTGRSFFFELRKGDPFAVKQAKFEQEQRDRAWRERLAAHGVIA